MKTNTKNNVLKLAMTIVAMFVFTSAWAQTHDGTAIPGQGNVTAYGNDGVTYMIEGSTIPVYAQPDPFYHPNYDFSIPTWTLTDGFIWVWDQTPVTGTETLSFSQNSAQDNYVEITAPAGSEGEYTVNVLEQAPAAWGGCDDGLGTDLTINVVTAPSVGFGGNQTVEGCAGGTDIPANINATIAGGWQNFHLAWALEIRTEDVNGTVDFYYDDETGLNPEAGQKNAVEHTTGSPDIIATAGDYDIISVSGFDVIGDKVTVYTYTLNSINDQASRFGDFIDLGGDASDLSAFTDFASGETYTVKVYPAPETGPIYHIPAGWTN